LSAFARSIFREIERLGGYDGRGVRRPVRGPDGEEVFLEAGMAAAVRGASAVRGGAGGLLAGVAVAFAVVAEIDEVEA
jgi:hypothetical protein